MTIWSAAVVIVAIWAIVTLFTRRHDHRIGVTRDEDGNPVFPPQTDSTEVERELAALRERVKVLERIAVDETGPRNLAHEIESLRDPDPGTKD